MDRQRVVDTLRECFAERPARIVAAYLFGSIARDTASAASDVDVGVVLAGGTPRSIDDYPVDVQRALERRLGTPVDVVVMNGAPADLVIRILRDGVLVHEGDRPARVAFEVNARNEFFDLEPILQRYRRTVLGSL